MKHRRLLFLAFFALGLLGCATTGTPDKKSMAEGYYNKGLSYLQKNDYPNALAEFHRSIQTDSKYKQSYYALGVAYDRQDKLDEAEKYLRKAVDIDSDFSDAYNMLGVVYSKQKRWKEALRAYKSALENKLYSSPHIAYINMGNMYMMQQEYDKAIDAYRESKRIVNQDFTIYRLGLALIEAGKIKDAVAEFREGLSIAPRNVEIRLALGLALLKDGNKPAALAEFRKVVELAPADSETYKTAKDYVATLSREELPNKRSK